jgi:hypothetical protein
MDEREIQASFFSAAGRAVFAPSHAKTQNFAREHIEIAKKYDRASGVALFEFDNDTGDLVGECILEISVEHDGPLDSPFLVGDRLVSEATLIVGGKVVDQYDAGFSRAYDAFFRGVDEKAKHRRATSCTKRVSETDEPASEVLYVPLLFSFCRHPSRSIPLVALSKESAGVRVTLDRVPGVRVTDVRLLADGIYLDPDVRKTFVDRPLLYQIEVAQTCVYDAPVGARTFDARLSFAGPVKCIFFSIEHPGEEPLLGAASLTFGGEQRFSVMPREWWSGASQKGFHGIAAPGADVYVANFSMHPTELEPSGATNFSMIPAANLRLELAAEAPEGVVVHVVALGYNYLGVKNGSSKILFGEISRDV